MVDLSENPAPTGKNIRVFAYGVARNRLLEAASRLNVNVEVVDELIDADVLVTLKSYYRKRRRLIADAEQRRTPVYVLRANTINQMENFLARALNLEAIDPDPFEVAVAEAEQAILLAQSGQAHDDLSPASAPVRRYQHQMARQANLVSHSYGQEPDRRVRIFSTRRTG